MEVLGTIIMTVGLLFMFFGIIGIYKFKNFFPRVLASAKIDSVGALTLMLGLMVYNGVSFFSLKLLLLVGIMFILNPLASHMLARSAYLSGYRLDDPEDNEGKAP